MSDKDVLGNRSNCEGKRRFIYMKEKVSVIVPIYNREAYLRRCIESLIQQTYENIEIILVDDCSKDKSVIIAKWYEDEYPSLCRLVQQKSNKGVSAARNLGLEMATGEWITFVDSDDWVEKDYINSMYEIAYKDNAMIVMSNFYYSFSDNTLKEVSTFRNLTTESSHKEKVALSNPCVCTRLFKKELFIKENIYFPEDIRRCEEVATVIPLLCATEKISLLRQPMYYYFQNMSSLSNEFQKESDITYFTKSIERMLERSKPGFEIELEFRAIVDLMYGMVMVMIRSKKLKEDIDQHIDWFIQRFPEWKKNPYLRKMEKGKQIFIYYADKRRYWILKFLIQGWDLIKKYVK